MRHVSRILGCAALVVAATTSCGGSTPARTTTKPNISSTSSLTTPAGTTPPGTTPARTSPTSQSEPSLFPLTITRTGGLAGFRDVLVVGGDGLVSVSRKGQKPLRCRLPPGVVERLTASLSQVPWAQIIPGSTRPSYPDDMVTTVRSPAGGPVRVEDPQAGTAGQVAVELLDDLSGPAASRLCPPA